MTDYVAREAEVSTTTSTSTSGNRTTTTTTIGATFDNGVVDVNIIPYMRGLAIYFRATGMRPNRRVWFFFDDQEITDYIVDTNQLLLTSNNDVSIFSPTTGGFRDSDIIEHTANTANNGFMVSQGRYWDDNDDGTDHPRRRLLRLLGLTNSFWPGQTIRGRISGTIATVLNLNIGGGHYLDSFFSDTSANTIRLPGYTHHVANNYWGVNGANTITLIPWGGSYRHVGDPVIAYIGDGTRGFDNVTRTLYLSNTYSQLNNDSGNIPPVGANSGNTIAFTIDGINHKVGQQGLGWYTDSEGTIDGVFIVPPGKFKIGQRLMRIIDNPINDTTDCSTKAEREFAALGLQQTKQDVTVISTETSTVVRETSGGSRGTGGSGSTYSGGGGGGGSSYDSSAGMDGNAGSTNTGVGYGSNFNTEGDPIAQTFFINNDQNPYGVFLSSVDLFFGSKDQIIPVEIFIRPTVNGYPSSYENIPGTRVSLPSEFIKLSEDGSQATKFTFDSPVYLPPGEYALVVFTTSINYEVFVSELGGTIIGTDRIVSEQPYIGSLFKSQNASTWEADQTKDLKFIMNKCYFVQSGEIDFYNEKPTSAFPMDITYTHIEDSVVSRTKINYEHSYDSGLSYDVYRPDTNRVMVEGRQYLSTAANGQYRLKATLATTHTDISPVIYHNTGIFHAIENYIDAGSIKDYSLTLQNPGYGYTPCTNLTLAITSSYGTGANAWATTNITGSIVKINFDSYGTNYIDTPIITIPASNATTTNAVITLSSEEDNRGGQILMKYISKTVTLEEGFDAADLRVWLTAYKPTGTDIKVYYKVRNTLDPDPFDVRPWVLMEQYTGSNVYSASRSYVDTREFEYRPVTDPDPISYVTKDGNGTYDVFNQYAIKINILSSDTTNYPILYDMRAIALPGLTPS